MAARRIRSLIGRNSRELRGKRDQLEGKLGHLTPAERQTLLSVIAEYDFSVEHKAGQQHVNADCLSRHIPLVTIAGDRTPLDGKLSNELSRENVFTAQQNDGYCKEMRGKNEN
jgi:hypothetical protein